MSVVTLLYHDVTEVGQKSSSGFGGPDSEIYKLTWGEFDQQLQALASSRVASYASVPEAKEVASARSFRLAFDDGGVSAERIAERLQTLGWQAHFFVTTDYIDRTRFLSKAQIRSLAQAGHVIGSHSCSHPLQMGRLSLAELIEEWKTSLGLLGDVLGRQILSASIPGGHYQRKVALAAARAGVSTLFTSEPSRRVTYVEGCRVVGRSWRAPRRDGFVNWPRGASSRATGHGHGGT